jgi:hypothetical protein
MSDAFKNYVRNLIKSLPQLLLQAGLQLLIAGQWIPGLALIGASGLASFVSGLIDTSSQDSKNDELEELKHIYDQTVKLMESIRENEEYYLKKRRELNADWAIESMDVNDMILTPYGNFSPDPKDYIIATKNPSALGNNVNVPVYMNIVNNSTSTVTAQEQTDPDGARRIMVLVDQVVQNGIASGKYDGAFNAKQARDSGRRVSG